MPFRADNACAEIIIVLFYAMILKEPCDIKPLLCLLKYNGIILIKKESEKT
jgi:hypothetical protein